MVSFSDLLSIAKDIGFFQFYLPFVLTFAIFYGLLEKVKIFGDKSRNINLIIALVAALYVIGFTPVGITFAQFLSNFFGQVGIILVSLIALGMIFFVLVPLSGKEVKDLFNPKYLIPIAALLAIGAYLSSGGLSLFPGISLPSGGFGLGLSDQDIVILIIIVLTILVIWWLTREESDRALIEKVKRRGLDKPPS